MSRLNPALTPQRASCRKAQASMLTLTHRARVELLKTNPRSLETCLRTGADALLTCATIHTNCHRESTFTLLNNLPGTMSALTTFINDNGLRIYKNPTSVDVPKVDLPTLLFGKEPHAHGNPISKLNNFIQTLSTPSPKNPHPSTSPPPHPPSTSQNPHYAL
jgi:hypothetical protein